jgi:transcription elongation factor Elf1
MTRDFTCPRCGEPDAVRGAPGPHGIVLTCEVCRHTWDRDDTPHCATCGSPDVRVTYRGVLAMGRASVTSQVGRHETLVCEHCDAEAIARWTNHGHPLPASHLTAAQALRT